MDFMQEEAMCLALDIVKRERDEARDDVMRLRAAMKAALALIPPAYEPPLDAVVLSHGCIPPIRKLLREALEEP